METVAADTYTDEVSTLQSDASWSPVYNDTTLENRRSYSSHEHLTNIHLVIYSLIGSFGMVDNGLVIIIIVFSKTMRNKVWKIFISFYTFIDIFWNVLLLLKSMIKIGLKDKVRPVTRRSRVQNPG